MPPNENERGTLDLLRKSGVCGVLILIFCQKAAFVTFYQSLKFLKRIL